MPDRILEMQERIDELENALAQAAHDLAATADRAAALAQMRERVVDESVREKRYAFIRISDEFGRSSYITIEQRFFTSPAGVGTWLEPFISGGLRGAGLAESREFALALEVLAEIAEQWQREAAGEAASE